MKTYLNGVYQDPGSLPVGSVDSSEIANGSIVNEDINSSAAIAISKLANVTAKEIVTAGTIENAILELDDSAASRVQTGFDAWTGAGSDYYTITGGKFQLDHAGIGYIKGKKVTWAAGQQTGVLSANTLNHVYINSSGLIGSTSTATEATFEDNIVLFEVLYDGTNYVVVKENHPYKMDTRSSRYLHNNLGIIVRNSANGAVIGKLGTTTGASADDRSMKVTGADVLEDHGLETTIPDSSSAAVTVNHYHTNAGGKWIRDSQATAFPMKYNSAGTATAIDSGKYGVFRIYVGKDDLETTTPTYYSVMHTAQFTNITQARNAITSGVVEATNELAGLELAQLGYIIVLNNASGGYFAEVQVQKSILRGNTTGAGATNIAALVSTNTSSFNGILSATDTNVQTALETIDDTIPLYKTSVTLTAANILALDTTPITLVAAPGTNKIVVPRMFYCFMDYGTTAYQNVATGDDIAFKYTSGSGPTAATLETNGFLGASSDQQRIVFPPSSSTTPVTNAALVASLLGPVDTGDSTLRIDIYYNIIDIS